MQKQPLTVEYLVRVKKDRLLLELLTDERGLSRVIRGPDIPESIRATDGWSFWQAADAKAGDTVTLKVIRQRVAVDDTS